MRVAIVQAETSARESLGEIVSKRYEVPWIALNEADAVGNCARDPPDLIVLDLGFPTEEGMTLAGRLSGELASDLLILTSGCEARHTFETMASGGLDALDMPASEKIDESLLFSRLDRIAQVLRPRTARRRPSPRHRYPLVCVGASTGGPEALAQLLGGLPGDFPGCVVICQHVGPSFVAGMAQWLGSQTKLPLYLASPGDAPYPGEVLVAGRGGLNLQMGRNGHFGETPGDGPHRPCIDVLMASVARHWSGPVLGILLSGLGGDGAQGLLALREKGHLTLVQNESSSAVFGMPKAAIDLGAADKVLSLEDILAELLSLARNQGRVAKLPRQ